MSDNLVILGTTYSNAAGFKATDDQDNVLTYTRGGGVTPTGTINIDDDGTYDVTNYASAEVAIDYISKTIPVLVINNTTTNKTIRSGLSSNIINSSGYIGIAAFMISPNSSRTISMPGGGFFMIISSTNDSPNYEVRVNNEVQSIFQNLENGLYKVYKIGTSVIPVTGGTIDIYETSDPTKENLVTNPLSVTSNGTYTAPAGTAYTPVTVSVPSQDNTLVVTLSWDDDYFGQNEGAWVPDATYAEILAAAQAGKTIATVVADWETSEATVDGIYNSTQSLYVYCVQQFETGHNTVYVLDSNGLEIDEEWDVVAPSGTINITQSGNTDVTQYVTANVPNADAYAGIAGDDEFYTSGANRRWRIRPRLYVDEAGWVSQDSVGGWNEFSAVPANTTITPSTSQQTVGGSKYMMEGSVTVAAMPSGSATPAASISATGATVSTGTNTLTLSKSVSNAPQVSAGYVSSGTVGNSSVSLTASVNTRSSSDLTASGDTVTAPAGYYASAATKSVASGTAGTPSATKGTVSNHSVSVTPSVTNTTGYITGGTKTGTAVTVSASELVSGTLSITSSGTKDVTNYASASVSAGTEGTPTATKGTVSNHQVSVTPSVTNTTGYITGGTKTGTAVTVTASELASGNKAISANGTNIDVVGYSTVSVAVPFSAITVSSSDPTGGSNGDVWIKTS